jgi:hypothetical protein
MWSDFHSDSRTSYYLFLRRGYLRSAGEAHSELKRMDAIVVALSAIPARNSWRGLLVAVIARAWRHLFGYPSIGALYLSTRRVMLTASMLGPCSSESARRLEGLTKRSSTNTGRRDV